MTNTRGLTYNIHEIGVYVDVRNEENLYHSSI